MSLFGEMDVDEIPDNPFNVDEEGTYDGFVSRAQYRETKDGVKKLVINYEVSEGGSPIESNNPQDGKNASEWLTVFPDLTRDELEKETPQNRSAILQHLSRVKRRLKSLGVNPADFTDPKELEGIEVQFVVVVSENADTGETYYNVKYVRAV